MRMTHFVLLGALTALPALPQDPGAGAGAQRQDQGGGAQRQEMMSKLQEDVKTAVANANLSEDQRKKFEDAQATLRDGAAARRSGERMDREKVRSAMQEIRGIVDNDAFKQEDRDRIKADLSSMRGMQGGDRRGRGKQ